MAVFLAERGATHCPTAYAAPTEQGIREEGEGELPCLAWNPRTGLLSRKPD